MGSKLEEGLKSLCCQYGWSYGIYWRVDGGDSGLLTVGGVYHEEGLGMILNGMLRQIHRIGDGIVGGVALTGRHQWVFSDGCFNEHGLNILQGSAALTLQFLAEIQTIVTLPLQPFGVFQFGSCQKIAESLEFLEQVKNMVQNKEIVSELLGHGVTHGTRQTNFGYGNINTIHGNDFIDSIPGKEYFKDSAAPLESRCVSSKNLHPSISSMSVQKAYTFTSNPLLLNSYQAASTRDHCLTSSDTGIYQHSAMTTCSPFTALVNNHESNSNDKMLALMEQQLLNMIGKQEFPMTQPVVSHGNLSQGFCQDSRITSSENVNGSKGAVAISGLSNVPLCFPSSFGGDGYQHCSKPLSQGHPLDIEPKLESASFLMTSENLATECATSTVTKSGAGRNTLQLDHKLRHEIDISTFPRNEGLLGAVTVTSAFNNNSKLASINNGMLPNKSADILSTCTGSSLDAGSDLKENPGAAPSLLPDQEIFDGMDLDLKNCSQGHPHWDDILIPEEGAKCSNPSTNLPECISGLDVDVERSKRDFFSDFGLEQIVAGVSAGNMIPCSSHSSASNINSVITAHNPKKQYSRTNVGSIPLYSSQVPSPVYVGRNTSTFTECNLDNLIQASSSNIVSRSQVSWIDDSYSMTAMNSVTLHDKGPEEHTKLQRKRARPGESTRPRPKDRQLIQDRVKELREIVPNGAKCSIDALLDRTIKHMLYLQNVTKYSEKLKQADESKMIGEENGVVLRDNTNGGDGGTTWAFEVAGQTMVCPIIVEDLSPPGQMLVEMLCEERGFFLEIADMIRGFGLTILKGVMEVRDHKIWARFLVEANREVTRMEIFLSLVQLLQQTANCGGLATQAASHGGDEQRLSQA